MARSRYQLLASDVPHRDFLINLMLLLTRLTTRLAADHKKKESNEIPHPDIAILLN
jgi:hypothetical protein